MFQPMMAAIAGRFSGEAAKDHVSEICRFHRIQASPGFRQAAAFVHTRLAQSGLDVETLSYAGDGRTFHWAYLSPPEWEAEEAELWLTGPGAERRKFADFHECKISLVQRSDATAPEGVTAELVVVDDGTEEEHYAGRDVRGKVVLTSASDLRRVRELAVDKHGAIGILYDGMSDSPPVRTRIDVPDARQYVSFWQAGDEKAPCWGFSLTPRLGDGLRKLARQAPERGPVTLWARVKSRFVPDGHIEVVSALIPGETDEEVLVVAHLCHPQPSANDNASGAGAAMEMALALHSLIGEGALARPRRGIRFLWVPEMTGTFAYLANHPERIGRTIAGINLDMVGQNQDLCGSSFLVERTPRAMPSFVDDLVIRIREEITHESKSHSGFGDYALFRHAVTPFSGGSDHYILSDPTVGIPCPMLIQWPDKFFHTSLDTIEKVDPPSLQRAGVVAATYAYFLAAAGLGEAEWLKSEMLARFTASITATCQDAVTQATQDASAGQLAARIAALRRRVAWELGLEVAALASLRRLASELDPSAAANQAARAASRALDDATSAIVSAAAGKGWDVSAAEAPRTPEHAAEGWEQDAASLVPVRKQRGPVSLTGFLPRLEPAEREEWRVFSRDHRKDIRVVPDLAMYWCDGRRTVAEIVDAVEMESGRRAEELIIGYFRLLHRLGLVGWV